MYPHVIQFETRDQAIFDELRLRGEVRQLTHRSSPLTRRATIPIRVARMLKVATHPKRADFQPALEVRSHVDSVPGPTTGSVSR